MQPLADNNFLSGAKGSVSDNSISSKSDLSIFDQFDEHKMQETAELLRPEIYCEEGNVGSSEKN